MMLFQTIELHPDSWACSVCGCQEKLRVMLPQMEELHLFPRSQLIRPDPYEHLFFLEHHVPSLSEDNFPSIRVPSPEGLRCNFN